jgi:hypothetical protein
MRYERRFTPTPKFAIIFQEGTFLSRNAGGVETVLIAETVLIRVEQKRAPEKLQIADHNPGVQSIPFLA